MSLGESHRIFLAPAVGFSVEGCKLAHRYKGLKMLLQVAKLVLIQFSRGREMKGKRGEYVGSWKQVNNVLEKYNSERFNKGTPTKETRQPLHTKF